MIFCFECHSTEAQFRWEYKMNEILNKFLLAGDKSIPEMHLKQPTERGKPAFTYSACGLFTKSKERIKKN